jgi:hypothetical protein
MLFLSLLKLLKLLLVLLSGNLIRLLTAYPHLYLWYHADLCSALGFFLFTATSVSLLGLALLFEREFIGEVFLVVDLANKEGRVVLHVGDQEFHKFFNEELNFIEEIV